MGGLSISQAKGQGVNADVLTLWRADGDAVLIFVFLFLYFYREHPVNKILFFIETKSFPSTLPYLFFPSFFFLDISFFWLEQPSLFSCS